MLGAGDIKLFAAIGAIMGLNFILYTLVFSFLSGGVVAAIIMLSKSNAKERFGNLKRYFKYCFLTGSLKPYDEFNEKNASFSKNDASKFHFTYAIFLGTIFALLLI